MANFTGYAFARLPLCVSHSKGMRPTAQGTWLPLFTLDESSPPTVTIISPAPGQNIDPSAEVVVEISDEDGLSLLDVFVDQPEGRLVVYQDGVFVAPFTGTSTPLETGTGRRLHMRRRSGWRGALTFHLRARDSRGAESEGTP